MNKVGKELCRAAELIAKRGAAEGPPRMVWDAMAGYEVP